MGKRVFCDRKCNARHEPGRPSFGQVLVGRDARGEDWVNIPDADLKFRRG
jgi:hypothetical protein